VEIAALVVANGIATLVRFLLMRAWIFHPRRLRVRTDQAGGQD
jgi:putative flippase GtrA